MLTRAPTTGAPPRRTRPVMAWTFDESGSQGRTEIGDWVVTRTRSADCAPDTRVAFAAAGVAGVRAILGVAESAEGTEAGWSGAPRDGRLFGGGDSFLEPPSAKTCSSLAVPPFDDVGVPPEVMATNCFPFTE